VRILAIISGNDGMDTAVLLWGADSSYLLVHMAMYACSPGVSRFNTRTQQSIDLKLQSKDRDMLSQVYEENDVVLGKP
jgi:hypothetical protein